MHAIELESLTRRYGRRRGIESLTLRVAEGSLYGFLGPNGAGKTTAIRVMLGFLRPSAGHARIGGLDCWRDAPRVKADVGYLPGDVRLYPWLTGEQALRFVGAVRGNDVRAHGRELAERFQLDMRVAVRRMSRGMRQKLGLVMALASKPRVLILDEPTSSLDPLMRDRLLEHLRGMARAGHTVFFSSHTLTEVEQLCDRIAIVREGKLLVDATLAEIRRDAGHAVSVRWSAGGAVPAELPRGLRLVRRDPDRWTGTFHGPIDALVAWLHAHPVDDLSIAPPDLETLFRRYYADDGGGPP